jgi:hypothetical protein
MGRSYHKRPICNTTGLQLSRTKEPGGISSEAQKGKILITFLDYAPFPICTSFSGHLESNGKFDRLYPLFLLNYCELLTIGIIFLKKYLYIFIIGFIIKENQI